jgi:hypothetical protein
VSISLFKRCMIKEWTNLRDLRHHGEAMHTNTGRLQADTPGTTHLYGPYSASLATERTCLVLA